MVNHPTLLRNYRTMTPGRFHPFNQRVYNSLSKLPDSTWEGHSNLMSSYLSASEKHNLLYHEALYGSKLVIAQRELLQVQIIDLLDEIATILEMLAFRNPQLLLLSGFDLGKERRSQPRAKVAPTPSEDMQVPGAEEPPSGSG